MKCHEHVCNWSSYIISDQIGWRYSTFDESWKGFFQYMNTGNIYHALDPNIFKCDCLNMDSCRRTVVVVWICWFLVWSVDHRVCTVCKIPMSILQADCTSNRWIAASTLDSQLAQDISKIAHIHTLWVACSICVATWFRLTVAWWCKCETKPDQWLTGVSA